MRQIELSALFKLLLQDINGQTFDATSVVRRGDKTAVGNGRSTTYLLKIGMFEGHTVIDFRAPFRQFQKQRIQHKQTGLFELTASKLTGWHRGNRHQ